MTMHQFILNVPPQLQALTMEMVTDVSRAIRTGFPLWKFNINARAIDHMPGHWLRYGGNDSGIENRVQADMSTERELLPTVPQGCPGVPWASWAPGTFPETPYEAPDPAAHPCTLNQPEILVCRSCREDFDAPFETFFYRDRNGPHGWRKWCKACCSERNAS